MAIWDEPVNWSAEFLRSQRFNKEIRDKQKFLFKRPREEVTITNGGSFNVPTAMAFIDETGFIVTIETTGRPLLVTICGSAIFTSGTANRAMYFDCFANNGYVSGGGTLRQATEGAFIVTAPNLALTNQQVCFQAYMVVDWLTAPSVYTIKPMWYATAGTVLSTANAPLTMTIEEL